MHWWEVHSCVVSFLSSSSSMSRCRLNRRWSNISGRHQGAIGDQVSLVEHRGCGNSSQVSKWALNSGEDEEDHPDGIPDCQTEESCAQLGRRSRRTENGLTQDLAAGPTKGLVAIWLSAGCLAAA